jgi:hypothetical protein
MAERSTVATSGVRPNEPARETFATFDNYGDAERAVVRGTGVGRMNYSTAALRGAGSGALVGWIFGLFNWIEPLISARVLAGYGLVFGAIVGALFGRLVHALPPDQRDFHSIRWLRPKHYDVVADLEVADRGLQLRASDNRKE